jgi:hypothetical protein
LGEFEAHTCAVPSFVGTGRFRRIQNSIRYE